MRPVPEIRTLAELCLVRARTHATHPAVADGDGSLTYAELADRAGAVAAVLAQHGVSPGDRVALQGRNSTGWVVAAFGVLLAGAALVPVGHGASEVERSRVLAGLDPVLLLLDDGLPAVDGITCLPLTWLTTTTVRRTRCTPAVTDAAAPALVLSSSGTTGATKSVPMTHEQLLRMYREVGELMDIRDTDRFLVAVPLAHSFGFNGLLLVALIFGAAVRLVPAYDPDVLPLVIREEGLTVLAGPPTIYHDLENAGPLPSVRLGIAGGQAVEIGDLVEVAGGLGIAEVVVGYGMTETCGTVAMTRLPTDRPPEQTSMATLVDVEVVVRDELGRDRVGEAGRVLVRGYNIARPYGVSVTLLPDGWFDTGDLGVLDDAGRLTVVGRSSDMVIVSGFNVHPGEVETALSTHPDVARVAVTGVPDRRRGQRLVAFVVPRRERLDVGQVDAFARDRLSAYKVPAAYHLMDELPVTSTGKLARSALRELAERWTATR